MDLFQSILQSITKNISSQEKHLDDIVAVLQEVLGVSFKKTQLKIIGTKLLITTDPTIKLAIKIKEQEILTLLQKQSIVNTTIG